MKFSFALILVVLCLAIAYGQDDATTSEPQAETTPEPQAETTPQPQAETTPQQAETTSQEPAEATTEGPSATCQREAGNCIRALRKFGITGCSDAIRDCPPVMRKAIREEIAKIFPFFS